MLEITATGDVTSTHLLGFLVDTCRLIGLVTWVSRIVALSRTIARISLSLVGRLGRLTLLDAEAHMD